MPTYDYRCNRCEYQFEEFQSISEKQLKKCPKCKKPSLKRLIGSGAGVIFKGSGFYQTDYKKNSPPPSESKSSDSKESTKKDSEKKNS